MSFISGQSHAFDILLASKFGVEAAILIHHFQHWVRINQVAKRNIKDGRCWTYQSRKSIQEHFPYWTFDEVRRLCEKLVNLGVLVTGNYNKSVIDKTLWYAFADEKAFGVDLETSKSFYERQKCLTRGKTATPIPDTKPTDALKKKEEEKGSLKGAQKESAPPPPPPKESFYKEKFEGKIMITKEQRDELLKKYGNMESLIDKYAEKLYRWSIKEPKKFAKYKRHDWVIEDWIDKDMAKGNSVSQVDDPVEKNWQLNQELVSELKVDCPNKCGGLYFFYKHRVLKDKNNPDFDISGVIDHKTFCQYLEKKYGVEIVKVRFPNG